LLLTKQLVKWISMTDNQKR